MEPLASRIRPTTLKDFVGQEHYDTISAYIKSLRAGDADAAIYYLARMIEGGEDSKCTDEVAEGVRLPQRLSKIPDKQGSVEDSYLPEKLKGKKYLRRKI